MKSPHSTEESIFEIIYPEIVVKNEQKSEYEEESDEEALERLGFDRALARLRGEDIPDEEEIPEEEYLCPSQRGYDAVKDEYDRMGCGWNDND